MSKRVILVIAAVFHATPALAQCDFNLTSARLLKTSMIRAFQACPGTEDPTPVEEMTATKAGIPACSPVEPRVYARTGLRTTYEFGPRGGCSVSLSAKIVPDCSEIEDIHNPGFSLGLQQGPCHVTYIKSRCSGIVDPDGDLIGSQDSGWKLAIRYRMSVDDQVGGDMTLVDFPISLDYSTPDRGRMSIDYNTAQALTDWIGTNAADLPECTSIEILDLVVRAPGGTEGLEFAKPGQATRPQE